MRKAIRIGRRGGISGGLSVFLLWPSRKTRSGTDIKNALNSLFSNLPSARAIGAAYLRSHPADRLDAETLVAALPTVAEHVRNDFSNARVVTVDGWMLAVTEARLCALAYLTG